MRWGNRFILVGLFALAGMAATTPAQGQELEPRLWANLPVDTSFLGLALGFSSGNVLLDPTLPVEGVEAEVVTVGARYLEPFGLAGRSARLEVVAPYCSSDWQGTVQGETRTRSITDFGDPRVKLAVNLVGSPALRAAEFRGYRQGTIVGASLQVIVPLGQYDPSRLINLGSNRWTFRPQLGISQAIGKRWTLEVTGSAWLFTTNDDYFGGQTLEQDPLYEVQAHLFYSFRPGLFVAINSGLADGGQTSVDGTVRNDLQTNTRSGVTLAVPVARRHGLSLSFATGVSTRAGADFDTVAVAYQYMWGGGG